jgi:diaminopimelate decarboxylase
MGTVLIDKLHDVISDTMPAAGMRTLDGIDLHALAEVVGTPFYAYSATALRERIGMLQIALRGLDAGICYAVKANPNLGLLKLMGDAGLGADIVSVGELRRALRAGIPAARVVFSGVGKREDEVTEALALGVGRYNVESRGELEMLQWLAARQQKHANVAVRINPGVDAGTHSKISTGRSQDKFGVSVDEARGWFAEAQRFPHLRLDGLHVHIGSQILDAAPFRKALHCIADFWRELRGAGHAITSIDVGGGLGVCYRRGHDRPLAVGDYVAIVREALAGFDGRILLEPGRYLVAEAGVLVSRVIRVKRGEQHEFLVLDAAMNDLQRPALYGAWHEIIPLHGDSVRGQAEYDVVGPVCETGDTFARGRTMPACHAGDLVAITAAGAYGASMASTYNSRPLAAEVLLDTGRYALLRRRQTFEDMIAGERADPEWCVA